MKNKIAYRLYLAINLLVVLTAVGCGNITPSIPPTTTKIIATITPTSTRIIPTITPTLTPYSSPTPVVTPPTISYHNSPALKAWLTWRTNFIAGIAWSPNNQQIATVAGDVSNNMRVHIIDLSAMRGSRFSEDAPDPAITFSPNGEELIVGLGGLEVWKLSSKTLLGQINLGLHSFFVAYFPGKSDSFMLATAYPFDGSNSSIEIVNLKSVGSTWESQPFLDVKGYLRNISLNSDGSLLAAATKYSDNSTDVGEHVLVWDLASKKKICSLHGMNVAFSTMNILGTAASDGISLWNARTCQLIKNFPSGPGYPYNISFSPDGKLLAFALDGNQIEILDTSSGEVAQKLNGVFAYAEYIRFSPDGRLLATISRSVDQTKNDAILIVWKVADDSLEPIEISPEFFEPAN